MNQILDASRLEFTEKNQAEFWNRDVEFHASFWLAAGYPIVAGIVRALEGRLRQLALPQNVQAMKETIDEHEDILMAITSPVVDEARINGASASMWTEPSGDGFRRVPVDATARRDRQPQRLLAESEWLDQRIQEIRNLRGDLPSACEARIKEELRLQFKHSGEYVAYVDSWESDDGTRRWVPKIIAAHASFEELSKQVEAKRPHIEEESLLHIDYQPELGG